MENILKDENPQRHFWRKISKSHSAAFEERFEEVKVLLLKESSKGQLIKSKVDNTQNGWRIHKIGSFKRKPVYTNSGKNLNQIRNFHTQPQVTITLMQCTQNQVSITQF